MIKNTQQQRLSQRFSPSQIQLMNMLAMPVLTFEQYLANEIEANPALDADPAAESAPENEFEPSSPEEDYPDTSRDDFDLSDYLPEGEDPDYIPGSQRDEEAGDRHSFIASQGAQSSFAEYLSEQLQLEPLSEKERVIGSYIIGNIDPDGYLRRPLPSISDDLAFKASIDASEGEIQKVLAVIQSFDPPGVGATSLQQCLLLQLNRRKEDSPPQNLAKRILGEFFDFLGKKNYDRIREKTGCLPEELSAALAEIARLNPKPGDNHSQWGMQVQPLGVTPDFIVRVDGNEIDVSLSESEEFPHLKISREYSDMLRQLNRVENPSRTQQETLSFVRGKIDSARWFIEAVNQRRTTLLRIMEAIARRQHRFLLSGDMADLAPLAQKDIAADVGMDISTVSRVASRKYADTPYGTLSLKGFFSEGLSNEQGEDVSSRAIKQNLSETIQNEDKKNPLTDEQLMAALLDRGYKIARRTVAKYREALGFPSARLRRQL